MRNLVAGGLDVCWVLVFVAIGRASHEEAGSLSGFAGTAWPFLVGLAVGWGAWRAWRRADALVPVGVGVWVTAVVVGMVLRVLAGQGTAAAFVVVATVFLGVGLLGWRGVAQFVPACK
jgi:FtsH-binding integral membrane protein